MSQIVWSDYQQADGRWGVKKLLGPFYYLLALKNSVSLPNQLTVLRFIMGILFFFILSLGLFDLALAVFLVATVTDFFDGYLARKRGLTSNFGRIADPVADKVIICGGFITLIAHAPTVVEAWVVVVIVTRELVVGTLRGYAELRGICFPSSTLGKWKMTFQCITLCALLFYAGHWTDNWWAKRGVDAMAWFTVIITAYSGLTYLYSAGHIFQRSARCIAIEKEPYGLL